MDELKSLDSLFEKKIFRIPDYQRGYAWKKSQLEDFWEDLINLSDRSHYTGLLALKEVSEINEDDNEYWLVKDHSYKMYHVVDGQQRLTTFVVFLQAFIDYVKELPEYKGKDDQDIYIVGTLSLKNVIDKYLFNINPRGKYRTYKFGYMGDKYVNVNPSDDYLRHTIFKEYGSPSREETLYTLNIGYAKSYFDKQLEALYAESGYDGLKEIYEKLTKNFLFNEYVIRNEFDVHVTFEAMNNWGKPLSNLELLKNRLIYLTMLLYPGEEFDATRKEKRKAINAAWKEVYDHLGRNAKHPLNDDEFLKAHWIMYFEGDKRKDYLKFLLGEQFSPKKVYERVGRDVSRESPEEQSTDREFDEIDNDDSEAEETVVETKERLQPLEIENYVNSLKESAKHWFNSYYPYLAKEELSYEEKKALDRLNRIGMGYFRPLVMSVLKNEKDTSKRIAFLDCVERFIFIVFRLHQTRSNYQRTVFHNASTNFNKKQLTIEQINATLNDAAAKNKYLNNDGTLKSKDLYERLKGYFKDGNKDGYYKWPVLRYFLYECELHLLSQSKQPKLSWEFWTKQGDKISIEHIFPQTLTENWKKSFASIDQKDYHSYSGSIGNLLLLPMSINASLQNDDFNNKKKVYLKGWHSGIDVAQNENWTPDTIKERGLKLLNFMEERWNFKFEDEQTKKELLFLDDEKTKY